MQQQEPTDGNETVQATIKPEHQIAYLQGKVKEAQKEAGEYYSMLIDVSEGFVAINKEREALIKRVEILEEELRSLRVDGPEESDEMADPPVAD